MIERCRQYLKEAIIQLGIGRVITEKTDSSKHQAVPYAEITFADNELRRDGSLVARHDGPEENQRTFRRKLYQRFEEARVSIVHRSKAQAEAARDNLLALLPVRIDDGSGNAILITAWSGETDEDGSVLKQETAALLSVRFEGGIYRDKTVRLISAVTDLEIEGEIMKEE